MMHFNLKVAMGLATTRYRGTTAEQQKHPENLSKEKIN
jgi:hypothetical protein